MKRVTVLQHLAAEGLGTIEPILKRQEISVRLIRVFDNEKIPENLETDSGLIVLGGSYGIYESAKYPFLLDEIRLIESAISKNKPVFGICLGSQLLASALGAKVYKSGQQEIGWHQITLSDAAKTDAIWSGIENQFMGYHWHGDVFELPAGAVSLASSEQTKYQAFRFADKFYGILFHPEATSEIIASMTADFAEESIEAGIAPKEILKDCVKYLSAFQTITDKIFNRWVKLID